MEKCCVLCCGPTNPKTRRKVLGESCRVARVVLSEIASVAIPPGLDIGSNDYLCGKCRTELCKIKNTQEKLEQLRAAMVDVLRSHHGPTQAHDPDDEGSTESLVELNVSDEDATDSQIAPGPSKRRCQAAQTPAASSGVAKESPSVQVYLNYYYPCNKSISYTTLQYIGQSQVPFRCEVVQH